LLSGLQAIKQRLAKAKEAKRAALLARRIQRREALLEVT
jgi:hypothetical protein